MHCEVNVTKNNKVLTAVIAVLSLLIAGCGGFLLYQHFNNQPSEQVPTEPSSSAITTVAETTEAPTGATEQTEGTTVPPEPNPIDFARWQGAENDDIYSWIQVPNTEIDYPVLQSKPDYDDNFYLDHGLDKDYRFAGSIYSQRANAQDYSDRVTVLYGHNMRDGSMFATLHWFADPDFFSENTAMTVYTPDKQLDYEIVAGIEYGSDHILNTHDFSDDAVYQRFLDEVILDSSAGNIRDGVTLDVSDRILILSTCQNWGDGRYLVVGRLVRETPLYAAE